jgi:hypothetical protein
MSFSILARGPVRERRNLNLQKKKMYDTLVLEEFLETRFIM